MSASYDNLALPEQFDQVIAAVTDFGGPVSAGDVPGR
jgi:hypothetical protein